MLCPGNDGRIRTYDLETGLDLGAQFDYQQGLASTAAVSADGGLLVETGGSSIALWHLDGGGPVSKVLPASTGYTSLEFDGEGNLLATRFPEFVGEGSDVLDPSIGEVVDPLDGVLAAVTTSRADPLFASFADGTAGFYDTTTNTRVAGVSIAVPYPYLAIPAGNSVLLNNLHDVQAVDVATGQLVPPVFHSDRNITWVYVTDGSRLFASEFGERLVPRDRAGQPTGGKTLVGSFVAAMSGDTMVVDSTNG